MFHDLVLSLKVLLISFGAKENYEGGTVGIRFRSLATGHYSVYFPLETQVTSRSQR